MKLTDKIGYGILVLIGIWLLSKTFWIGIGVVVAALTAILYTNKWVK